jgi:hypothetical protein
VPANRVLALATLCMAAVFALFQMRRGGALVYGIGVCQGLAHGLLMAVNAVLWMGYFGRGNLGKIKVTTTTTMVAATAIEPLAVGGSFAVIDSYQPILAGFALLPLGLSAAALFATPPKLSAA